MTKKSTLRALVMSALALLLCVSMLIGTTFAWFTDSVTSGQNKIQAGNLDVELYYTYDAAVAADVDSTAWLPVDSATNVFGYDLWEPGFTKVAYFKVANEGSLALKYQLSADVYAETAGKNQAGAEFFLSDYIKTALVETTATREDILSLQGVNLKASFAMGAGALAKESEEVVGLAIWMPTTVGNEANHNGTNVPSITFGINLIATQEMSEIDSFGSDYDEKATYPSIENAFETHSGNILVEDGASDHEVKLLSNEINADTGEHVKKGSVVVPAGAVVDGAKTIEATVKKLNVVDSRVPVAANEQATTLDIKVTNIKEGNTLPIRVTTNIGAGLGTIRLYHNNLEIPYITYNNNTGELVFESTSFSPFTYVYDGQAPELSDSDVPTAEVEKNPLDENGNSLENVAIDWKGYGGYTTGDPNQTLNAVYRFTSPHDSTTVQNSAYKDWYCDYYVKLDSDIIGETLPAYSIVLGGNYGGYGWVGFDNPEVEIGTYIPLLGSVFPDNGNVSTWTYAEVVGIVKEFLCGVGVSTYLPEAERTDLTGATFTVELRLINPENTDQYIAVNTVVYDFDTNTSETYSSKELN